MNGEWSTMTHYIWANSIEEALKAFREGYGQSVPPNKKEMNIYANYPEIHLYKITMRISQVTDKNVIGAKGSRNIIKGDREL